MELLQSIQSNLVLVFFPLVFFLFPPEIDQRTRKLAKLTFILAMLIYTYMLFQHYVIGVSYYQELKLEAAKLSDQGIIAQLNYLIEKGYYWISGISIRGYRLADVAPKLFLHHVYISVYYALALIFCLDLFRKIKQVPLKILLLVVALAFIAVIWYLPSIITKVAIPIVLIAAGFLVYKKWGVILALVMILAGSSVFYMNREVVDEWKWIERKDLLSKKPVLIDYFRYHVYSCAYSQLKNNFLFGMGGGDVDLYINQCTPDEDWPGLSEEKRRMNTHSQFLHYFLSGGIIGLALFVLLWVTLIYLAIRRKNHMLLMVVLLVLLHSIFENFLSRLWGAFFLSYFTFLTLQPIRENEFLPLRWRRSNKLKKSIED